MRGKNWGLVSMISESVITGTVENGPSVIRTKTIENGPSVNRTKTVERTEYMVDIEFSINSINPVCN